MWEEIATQSVGSISCIFIGCMGSGIPEHYVTGKCGLLTFCSKGYRRRGWVGSKKGQVEHYIIGSFLFRRPQTSFSDE